MEYGATIRERKDIQKTVEETDLYNTLKKKFEELKEERSKLDKERWELCAFLMHRTRSQERGFSPVPDIRLYTSVSARAFDVLITGFFSGVMSPSSVWFQSEFSPPDFSDSDSVEGADKFMTKLDSITRDRLYRSKFYEQKKLALKDTFATGSSAFYMQWNNKKKRLNVKTLPPWDWWIDTDEDGDVDTFFYRYTLTAEKAYKQFGDELPAKMRKICAVDRTKIFEFIMCVYPRYGMRNAKGTQIISTEKNFAVVDISLDYGRVIREGGSDFFPVIVHRADMSGDNQYGSSPVMRALPEIRKLNKLAYELGLSIAKINHSPAVMTQAVADKYSDDPNARIIVTSMEQAPIPLQKSQSVEWAYNMFKEQSDLVSKLLYNDYYYYLTNQDKVLTATQSQLMKTEQLDGMSGMFDNMQCENLEPTLRLVFWILSSNKQFPEMPKEMLKSSSSQINFVMNSVMAQQLKVYQQRDPSIAGFELLERMKNVGLEDELKNVDKDWLVRTLFKSNVSPESIVEKSVVKKLRMQEQEMMKQQMELEQAKTASESIRNLGGKSNVNNPSGANQTGANQSA